MTDDILTGNMESTRDMTDLENSQKLSDIKFEHDENPIKTCKYCKKEFDGNFEIKDFSIICPYCKKPQS